MGKTEDKPQLMASGVGEEAYPPRVLPEQVSVGLLLVIGYAATWFLAGAVIAPGGGVLVDDGAVWAVIFIWLGAQIGGATAAALKLPPLLGMLLSGKGGGGGLYKSSAVV
jgi:hypothetical protein